MREKRDPLSESKELEDVLAKIRLMLPDLHQQYHLKSLGIFGSFVRGEEEMDSDLDLLAEFDQPISLFRMVDLEDALSRSMGRKVDLVLRSTLKKHIGERILSEVVMA
ncbi:MAG: nucleotidyltransferase family protein [bacterium]